MPSVEQVQVGHTLLVTTGLLVFITCLFLAGFMVGANWAAGKSRRAHEDTGDSHHESWLNQLKF